jgi:hypothetical protein
VLFFYFKLYTILQISTNKNGTLSVAGLKEEVFPVHARRFLNRFNKLRTIMPSKPDRTQCKAQ